MRPTIISISGFSSESGKTSLLCGLLERSPNWEAIKITRGHYRSCGKDPHACCVSNLLGDKPLVLSGYELTYKAGKDTGRFWESGASNVHWVVVTGDQVEAGTRAAVERVTSQAVLIEGNSFLKYIHSDFPIMVARPPFDSIKSSALSIMPRVRALYLSFCEPHTPGVGDFLAKLSNRIPALRDTPIYYEKDLGTLVEKIGEFSAPM